MKYLEKLAEIKIRLDTGVGILNWAKNMILMTAALKYIISLNLFGTVLLGIAITGLMYFIGVLLLDKFNFPQVETALRDGKYNPFLKALDAKVSGAKVIKNCPELETECECPKCERKKKYLYSRTD